MSRRRLALLLTGLLLPLTACGAEPEPGAVDAEATAAMTPTSPPPSTPDGAGEPGPAEGADPTTDATDATRGPTATPERTGRPSPPRPTQAAPVPSVLRFTATTVDGKAFEGASLAGKPALLWFWAPWCPVCRSEIPLVESLAKRYGDRLGVVGVGSLDDAAAIAGFAEGTEGVIQLSDARGELWRRFKIVEQSSFVLLDASGSVAHRSGYADSGGVADAVARAVG